VKRPARRDVGPVVHSPKRYGVRSGAELSWPLAGFTDFLVENSVASSCLRDPPDRPCLACGISQPKPESPPNELHASYP